MSVLLDTNILARLTQSTSPQHSVARSAVNSLQKAGERLCIVPQVLYEFWVICTRPIGNPSNGLGISVDQVKTEISRAHALFTFLPDTPGVYMEWERLVVVHQIKGKNCARCPAHGGNERARHQPASIVQCPRFCTLPGNPNHRPHPRSGRVVAD